MLDSLKNLGFTYATRSGLSIGIDDLIIPKEKAPLVEKARDEVIKVESQYLEGAITNGERYNKVIAIWSEATEDIANAMFGEMEEIDKEGRKFNPVYIMADSGARGSKQQIRQLAGMRGLMAKPSGEIIETPITANFREGLDGACSTSSRRTARARAWPTRRSRRPTRATSRAVSWTWRRTSSSTSSTAARWTASRRGPSSRAARSSSRCATASSAGRRSRRSPTRSPAR